MDIKQAINDRRSIRAFIKESVTQEILREVLALATRVVSAVNAWPWEFAVAADDVLGTVRQDNTTAYYTIHSLSPDDPGIMWRAFIGSTTVRSARRY